jgi:hypothetical protein
MVQSYATARDLDSATPQDNQWTKLPDLGIGYHDTGFKTAEWRNYEQKQWHDGWQTRPDYGCGEQSVDCMGHCEVLR